MERAIKKFRSRPERSFSTRALLCGVSVRAVSLAAMALMLAGCTLPDSLGYGEVPCLVIPPDIHPVLSAFRRESETLWTVRWYGADGRMQERHGVRGPTVIMLDEEGITPVLMTEETDLPLFTDRIIPPAGALFPVQATEGESRCELRPTRISGAAARCAEQVILGAAAGSAPGKTLISSFDWSRLITLADGLAYPEDADTRGMAQRILEGAFSSRYVTELPGVSLPTPPDPRIAPGDWLYPAQSTRQATQVSENGTAAVVLHPGLNRFFMSGGVLDLQASENEIVCTFFRSYD